MDPIISPIWFYVIELFDKVLIISAMTLALSLVFLILIIVDSGGSFREEHKTIYHILIGIVVVSLILVIVVPSRTVMYQMLAASIITPDNITSAENNVVEFIKKIAEGVSEYK